MARGSQLHVTPHVSPPTIVYPCSLQPTYPLSTLLFPACLFSQHRPSAPPPPLLLIPVFIQFPQATPPLFNQHSCNSEPPSFNQPDLFNHPPLQLPLSETSTIEFPHFVWNFRCLFQRCFLTTTVHGGAVPLALLLARRGSSSPDCGNQFSLRDGR